MTAVVVIPWHDTGDVYRQRAFVDVRAWWARHGFETVAAAGRQDEQGWSKGAAVWAGVQLALAESGASVLLIADADVVPQSASVVDAVVKLERSARGWGGPSWAMPTVRVIRLTEAGSEVARATGLDYVTQDIPVPALVERDYRQHAGGGLVAITVGGYMTCPMDPRFRGWGQEDDAWGRALYALLGEPYRGTGKLVHLWHPPSVPPGVGEGSADSVALFRRYYAARHDRTEMTWLVGEAIAALTGGES